MSALDKPSLTANVFYGQPLNITGHDLDISYYAYKKNVIVYCTEIGQSGLT